MQRRALAFRHERRLLAAGACYAMLPSKSLFICAHLVEVPDDLAGDVLPPRLLVVHDASRGREDDVTELTRGQEVDDPLLHVAELDVVPWADDAGLVEAVSACQWCKPSQDNESPTGH